jgi:hypothetical protein
MIKIVQFFGLGDVFGTKKGGLTKSQPSLRLTSIQQSGNYLRGWYF